MRVFRTAVYTVLILAILVTLIVKHRQRMAMSPGGKTPASVALADARKLHIPAWLLIHSPICQACEEMEKVYEKLEPDFAGKVKFVKVDFNNPAGQDLVRSFNVRLVPTSVFIGSDGKVVAKKIGAMPLDETKTILIGLRKQ